MSGRGLRAVSDLGQTLLGYLLKADDIVANTPQKQMAKRILQMREQGNASAVTDEMMNQADPQTMFNYTPMTMDTASRMDRARALGFIPEERQFHGSSSHGDIDRFAFDDPERPIYTSDNPAVSNTYTDRYDSGMYDLLVKRGDPFDFSADAKGAHYRGLNPYLRADDGNQLFNQFQKSGVGIDTDSDAPLNFPLSDVLTGKDDDPDILKRIDFMQGVTGSAPNELPLSPMSTDTIANAMLETMEIPSSQDGGRITYGRLENIIDRGPFSPRPDEVPDIYKDYKEFQAAARKPSTDQITTDATRIRSRFARFDPAFSHLKNLTAAGLPVSVGLSYLLNDPDTTEKEIEQYLAEVKG